MEVVLEETAIETGTHLFIIFIIQDAIVNLTLSILTKSADFP